MRLLFLLVCCCCVIGQEYMLPPITPCTREPCVRGTCILNPATANGFSCDCDRRFQGSLCTEDVNECEFETCSNVGVCINKNLTRLSPLKDSETGFVCSCPEGRAGSKCEIVVDLCAVRGTDEEKGPYCLHGTCQLNKCYCQDGWAGSRCERAVPTTQDFVTSGCTTLGIVASLAKESFGNGKCDPDFNIESCFFDGFDCVTKDAKRSELRPQCCFNNSNEDLNMCSRSYADGKCREKCNIVECGFDGGDCTGATVKPRLHDPEIGLLLFTDPYNVILNLRRMQFEIGRRMYNAHVRLAFDNGGPMIFQWNPSVSNNTLGHRIATDDNSLTSVQREFSSFGTLVFFNIDLEGCKAKKSSRIFPENINCFGHEDTAARYLSIELSQSGNAAIGDGLKVHVVLPVNSFRLHWQHIPLWVIVWIIACLLFVLTMLVFLLISYKCRKSPKAALPDWPLSDSTSLEYSEALKTPDTPDCVYDCPDRGFFNNNINQSPCVEEGNQILEAVRRGDVNYVKRMIVERISFSGQRDRNGQGLLHLAVGGNDAAMLKILLHEADPGHIEILERNNAGQSPLVYASSVGHPQLDIYILMVEAISKRRNSVTTLPKSPSGYGCGDHRSTLPLSHESDEQWALRDSIGRSAVHYAAQNNLPQLVHYLSSYGADVDLIDARGDAPLHVATRAGNTSAVIALLDCNAARIIRDADGLTPLTIAENRGFTKLSDALRHRIPGSSHHQNSIRKIKRRRVPAGFDVNCRASSDGYCSLESAQRSVVTETANGLEDQPTLIIPLANGPPDCAPRDPGRRISTPVDDLSPLNHYVFGGNVTPLNRSFFGSELYVNCTSGYSSVRASSIPRPRILTPPVKIIEEEARRSYTLPSLVAEAGRCDEQNYEKTDHSYAKVIPTRYKRKERQSVQDLQCTRPMSPVVPQNPPPMQTFKPLH